MKRLLILAALAVVAFAPAAGANSSVNQTGCHHGASDQPCKPDPQPDHGNDCSNPSGGNQDHCPDTSTTTTTATAPAPVTTTTTDPAPSTLGTPASTSTTMAGPSTSAPPATSGDPTLRRCDSIELCPPATATAPASTELPMTGAGDIVLMVWGAGFLGLGLILLRASR